MCPLTRGLHQSPEQLPVFKRQLELSGAVEAGELAKRAIFATTTKELHACVVLVPLPLAQWVDGKADSAVRVQFELLAAQPKAMPGTTSVQGKGALFLMSLDPAFHLPPPAWPPFILFACL